jgi:hypothetical protein
LTEFGWPYQVTSKVSEVYTRTGSKFLYGYLLYESRFETPLSLIDAVLTEALLLLAVLDHPFIVL